MNTDGRKMKRYSLGVDWNSAGRPEPCAKEMSAGRFILFADHAALLRAVAEEVGKMEHSKDCDCIPDPADFLDRPEDLCNCPRGKVLAMLEVE